MFIQLPLVIPSCISPHFHDAFHQTDVVIMDFAKAFDKVSHWRLVLKLRSYGITGQINKGIENFLQHRFQF